MFTLSFVLEDWALHELVQSSAQRRVAILLVASSYVTWTYQTHTFSNSIETLTVAWSLVLIQRIVENKVNALLNTSITKHLTDFTAALFSLCLWDPLICGGVWHIQPHYISSLSSNSCPSLDTPSHQKVLQLPLKTKILAKDLNRPFSLVSIVLSGLLTAFIAVCLDTKFYTDHSVNWSYLFSHPTITPLNNLKYNLQSSNLATHGLHPWYQHTLFNLTQLIGPATLLLFVQPQLSLRLYSAISGIFVLSIFQHQEARFLLPSIPLILSSVKLPRNRTYLRVWTGLWIVFNVFFGLLMGTYHQGGVVPAQVFLSKQADATAAIWWKTYSPPVWLLNGKNEVLTTHDMMGMKGPLVLRELLAKAACQSNSANETAENEGTYLIAPLSATFLDNYTSNVSPEVHFQEVWRYRKHLNLDDLEFGDDGVWPTLRRVIGRRGLAAWRVTKKCLNN
jgi:phosphatidylinositol glycan class Z